MKFSIRWRDDQSYYVREIFGMPWEKHARRTIFDSIEDAQEEMREKCGDLWLASVVYVTEDDPADAQIRYLEATLRADEEFYEQLALELGVLSVDRAGARTLVRTLLERPVADCPY